jgi:hypothetical protein
MRTASAVTSGPIPSPATTSILSFIIVSLPRMAEFAIAEVLS